MSDMMIPWSDAAKYAAGGKWEPNATNFPAFKSFWKCQEAAGASAWVDSIMGISIPATIAAGSNANCRDLPILTSVAPSSGTLAGLHGGGTGCTILFGVFKGVAFAGIAIGNVASGNRLSVISSSASSTANDGTTNVNGGTLTAGTDTMGQGIIVDFAGNVRAFQVGTAGASWSVAAGNAVGALTATLPNTFTISSGSITDFYGVVGAHFSAKPPDSVLQIGFSWMTAQWQAGNKVLCPIFAGMT